jgi:hypothetical protein
VYVFLLDMQGHAADDVVSKALAAVEPDAVLPDLGSISRFSTAA